MLPMNLEIYEINEVMKSKTVTNHDHKLEPYWDG